LANYGKFSPVIRQKLPDYPTNDSRWDDWLDEQEHYILNGFQSGGTYITGRYYFHLNFGKLKLLDENNYETISSPYHVDVYNDLFNFIDDIEKRGKDGFIWKARDKGFSYSMTSLALKETQFHNNNTIVTLFPKGEQVQHMSNFIEKYKTSWNELPSCMRHSPNIKNSENLLHYGWEETDEETKESKFYGRNSKIAFMKVVNKDVAKSFRAKFIIVDEAGEVDCLIPLIMANRANMKKGATKFGTTLIGGTSNSVHKGYADVCELWNDTHLGFEKFKILAQQALFGFEKGLDGKPEPFINFETGESLQDKALVFLKKELEGIKKMKNKKAEMEHRQNYPTCEDDMFLRFTASPFAAELLSKQRSEILTNKTLTDSIDIGTLYQTVEDGKKVVKFRHDANGKWKILKHPSKDLMRKDVGAVDGYKTNQAVDSDSLGCIMVYRDFQGTENVGNLPICLYHHRPETKEQFNYDAMLTGMYYDIQMLYEAIDEDMINYFISNAMERHLAKRPNLLSALGSTAQNKYGVVPSEHNKSIALEYAIEEFRHYHENIAFIELIDDLSGFGIRNTDIAMTYLWCILHAKNNATYLQRKENLEKKTVVSFTPYMTKIGGEPKWITTFKEHVTLQKQNYGYSG
jgi:hypothetical protein